jgi:hypothetical protein
MTDAAEEAHRSQSPYRLEVLDATDDPPRTHTVRTVGAWSAQIVDSGGTLGDPIGKRHAVDLDAWADHDPERVTLAIGFVLPDGFECHRGDDVVPGSVYADVLEFDPDDARFSWADDAGRVRPSGATLRALRAVLGGDEGVVTDPESNVHDVSLAAWAGRDADETWLQVTFCHQQRSAPYGFHGSRGDARWHWRAMDSLAAPPA